jgi:hypothetical protein
MLKIGKYIVRRYDNLNIVVEKEVPKRAKSDSGEIVETGELKSAVLGYFPNVSLALNRVFKEMIVESLDDANDVADLKATVERIGREIIEATKGLRLEKAAEAASEASSGEDEEDGVEAEEIATEEA